MQTKLAAKAAHLSRTIFASLPWGFRVANLLEKLATSTQESFGRYAYAEFIKAGVEGLPPVKGQPALSFREQMHGPRGADKLPAGYGKEFGIQVWRLALGKFHNPELVEEAIAKLMIKMVQGGVRIQEGAPLKTAESYLIKSVLNNVKDMLIQRRRERSMPTQEDDEGGVAEIDIADPHAFQALETMIPRSEMAAIMRDLRQISERAPSWVEAQLDGRTDRDLAAEWGVTPAAIINFKNRHLDKIKAVILKHLQDAAA